MSNLRLHLPAPRSAAARVGPAMPLGRHLVESGIISSRDLLHGLDLQRRIDSPLGEILIAEGLATPPKSSTP
jgi:hypothetical protein